MNQMPFNLTEKTGPRSVPAQPNRAAEQLNRHYDKRMYTLQTGKFFGGSDFHNLGYWLPGTRTPKEACENLMEMLLAFIPRPTGTILDAGCGKGETTRYLLSYYPPEAITGINISEKQLESCRIKAPGCKFLLMDATRLDLEDASFDNIICVEAAFHFRTREDFFHEAFRVLKPTGRLVLSDILVTKPAEMRDPLRDPRNYVQGVEQYRRLCRRVGFKYVEVLNATYQCWVRCYEHRLRVLQNKFLKGELDPPTYTRRKKQIFRKARRTRYYLLACAMKSA
jgi:cyclopropane fatty-acyl-phospholipid synthase-like methyltransferase